MNPKNLREQIAWAIVASGEMPEVESLIFWKGPTKEPFLSLWSEGWRKYRARHQWLTTVVVIHFWKSPAGERRHLKIKKGAL